MIKKKINFILLLLILTSLFPTYGHAKQALQDKRDNQIKATRHPIKHMKLLIISSIMLLLLFFIATKRDRSNSSLSLDKPKQDKLAHAIKVMKYALNLLETTTSIPKNIQQERNDLFRTIMVEYNKKHKETIELSKAIKNQENQSLMHKHKIKESLNKFFEIAKKITTSDDFSIEIEDDITYYKKTYPNANFLEENELQYKNNIPDSLIYQKSATMLKPLSSAEYKEEEKGINIANYFSKQLLLKFYDNKEVKTARKNILNCLLLIKVIKSIALLEKKWCLLIDRNKLVDLKVWDLTNQPDIINHLNKTAKEELQKLQQNSKFKNNSLPKWEDRKSFQNLTSITNKITNSINYFYQSAKDAVEGKISTQNFLKSKMINLATDCYKKIKQHFNKEHGLDESKECVDYLLLKSLEQFYKSPSITEIRKKINAIQHSSSRNHTLNKE